MAKVEWSDYADETLRGIFDYIAADSPRQAALFLEGVDKAVDRLALFPLSGRITPEMADEIRREVLFGAYRIMYEVTRDRVFITNVVHGARNWSPE